MIKNINLSWKIVGMNNRDIMVFVWVSDRLIVVFYVLCCTPFMYIVEKICWYILARSVRTLLLQMSHAFWPRVLNVLTHFLCILIRCTECFFFHMIDVF